MEKCGNTNKNIKEPLKILTGFIFKLIAKINKKFSFRPIFFVGEIKAAENSVDKRNYFKHSIIGG